MTYPSHLNPEHKKDHQHRGLLPFLGMASGASVSAIYLNQPLLHEMGQTFHATSSQVGAVAVATQMGYAAGILLFVPMGDVAERRGLIIKLFAAVTLAMIAAAFAPALSVLVLASVAIGITAAVTHILVPIAPELAEPKDSGRAIGTVMTGLLLGILLGRAASGGIAQVLNWRAVFLAAALMTASFVPLIRWTLPKLPPVKAVHYREALSSLWKLVVEQPTLREASVVAFFAFAAFSSFWTTLPFLLSTPHYKLGAGVAGGFGILGAAGALAASFAGRAADRKGSRWVVAMGLCTVSAGFVVLWAAGYHIAGLIAGVIIIDLGQQSLQIANQTRIFSLVEGARSRINTIYMIVFFLGGAAGSALSTIAWSRWQWNGVCALSLSLLALSGLRHALGSEHSARKHLSAIARLDPETRAGD